MSQTLREVLIKVAIQMDATGGLRMPDSSAVDRAMEEAGKRAGAAFNRGMNSAGGAGRPGSPNGGIVGGGNRSGTYLGLSEMTIRNSLREIEQQEIMLKRISYGQQEVSKSTALSTEKIKGMTTASLELVRGLSMLGVATDSDAGKWLKYAAAAQGALDTMNSVRGIAGNLPGAGRLAALGSRLAPGGIAAGTTIGAIGGIAFGGAYALGAANDMISGRPLGEQSNLFGVDILGDRAAGRRAGNQTGYWNRILGSDQREIGRWYSETNRRVNFGMNQFRQSMEDMGASGSTRLTEFDSRAGGLRARMAEMANAEKFNDVEGVGAARRNVENLRMENRLLEERAGILRDIGRELKAEEELIRGNVEATRQQLRAEEGRMKGAAADFGRRDPATQAKARDIAKKLQGGGKLTLDEARFLEASGLGGRMTNEFFEQRGKEAGFEGVAEGTGLNEGVKGIGAALKAMEDAANTALEDIAAEIENNTATRKVTNDKLEEVFNAMLESENDLRKKIEAVLEKLNAAEGGQQKRAMQDPQFVPFGA